MIHLFGFVFFDKSLDDGHFEMGAGEGVLGEEAIAEHGAEGAAEPFADGDSEAHLLSFENPGREHVGKGFAEHALGAAFEKLGRGEGGGELDEFMIHERRADFQGVKHGAAVDFGEEVVGEIENSIYGQRALNGRPSFEKSLEIPRHSAKADGRGFAKQFLDQSIVEDAKV